MRSIDRNVGWPNYFDIQRWMGKLLSEPKWHEDLFDFHTHQEWQRVSSDIVRWNRLTGLVSKIRVLPCFQQRFRKAAIGLTNRNHNGLSRIRFSSDSKCAYRENFNAASAQNRSQRPMIHVGLRRKYYVRKQLSRLLRSHRLPLDLIKSL